MKKQQGFTLVELIVVIAILAILAGVAVPVYHGYIKKSNDAVSVQNAYAANQAYLLDSITSGEGHDMLVYQDTPNRILTIKDNGLISEVYPDMQSALSSLTGGDAEDYGIINTSVDKLYAVVEGESDWQGKSVVFVGDSITAGSGTTKTYHAYIGDTGAFESVTSMGIGGSCISAKSDYGAGNTPLIHRYASIPASDLIVIFMGTNDYGHETPLGSISDTSDISFYGALNVIIPGILNQHPESRLVFVTLIHRYGFGTSKITGEKFTYDHIANGRGHALGDYVGAIKSACAKYSVPVIDLYSQCPIDPANSADQAAFFPDGLHPNAAGHAILAELIQNNLQWIPQRAPGTPNVNTPELPENGGAEDDAEDDPAVEPLNSGMQFGNKFASAYVNDTTRASSVRNIYLKVGQKVTLRNTAKYQWALAKTENESSTANLGYYPSSGWSSLPSFTVSVEGYYGLTVKKNDNTSFNFNGEDPKDLIGYLLIE